MLSCRWYVYLFTADNQSVVDLPTYVLLDMVDVLRRDPCSFLRRIVLSGRGGIRNRGL